MEYPEFTRAEMAEHFGRTKNWTYDALKPFLHKGTVQMVAANDNRELVFAFQRPVAKSTPRNRLKPKAQSVSEPVPGTGKQKKVSARKEIRSIVDTARAQGYMVVTQGDGHIKVVHPSDPGKKATLASTPAMGETNGKRQLQSIGVKF
jgi:hypothetical protein